MILPCRCCLPWDSRGTPDRNAAVVAILAQELQRHAPVDLKETLTRSIFVEKVRLCKCSFIIHVRTGPLLGMPPRYHDAWSRSSPSCCQNDWKSSHADRTPEGCRGCSHRDTRGPTAETGGASSRGKKHKCQTREGTNENILKITPVDFWNPQKILHNKKGSLDKPLRKSRRRMLMLVTPIRRQCKLWNPWQKQRRT